MLRSTTVTAFLTLGLIGCGNAQAGPPQAEAGDTTVQDWEAQPPLWTPHSILIPRASRPIVAVDSAADSLRIDSTGANPTEPDSTEMHSKKRIFNISPADSARWPVRGPEPLPGAILPEHRIVAFYGNPLSKKMGILGEVPPEEMLPRLEKVATQWAAADSGQRVLPALHLIAT
ncbi:MAG TPA: hypothetical protein VGJ36_07915, partial [Gemmatimonadales bacterium]